VKIFKKIKGIVKIFENQKYHDGLVDAQTEKVLSQRIS
jgi:hypothetical protein